jgi:hypothetical protein
MILRKIQKELMIMTQMDYFYNHKMKKKNGTKSMRLLSVICLSSNIYNILHEIIQFFSKFSKRIAFIAFYKKIIV